jgi:hypothetical protein
MKKKKKIPWKKKLRKADYKPFFINCLNPYQEAIKWFQNFREKFIKLNENRWFIFFGYAVRFIILVMYLFKISSCVIVVHY